MVTEVRRSTKKYEEVPRSTKKSKKSAFPPLLSTQAPIYDYFNLLLWCHQEIGGFPEISFCNNMDSDEKYMIVKQIQLTTREELISSARIKKFVHLH